MQTSVQNEYNNSLHKYIFINPNAYPITRYRMHYKSVTFSRPPICFAHSKFHFTNDAVHIFHRRHVSPTNKTSSRFKPVAPVAHLIRVVTAVDVVMSDENFVRTIRQVHFACTPDGNYMTWMRRDALVSPGSVQWKRIVQFSPGPSSSRMDDVQRASERISPPARRG